MRENWIWYALGGAAVLGLGYYLYQRSQPPPYQPYQPALAPAGNGGAVLPEAPADSMSPATLENMALRLQPSPSSTTPLVSVTAVSRTIPMPGVRNVNPMGFSL